MLVFSKAAVMQELSDSLAHDILCRVHVRVHPTAQFGRLKRFERLDFSASCLFSVRQNSSTPAASTNCDNGRTVSDALFTQGFFEVGSPIFLLPRRNAGR